MEILKDIAKNVIAGNDEEVAEEVAQAIQSEVPTIEILDDGLIAGMNVVFAEYAVGQPVESQCETAFGDDLVVEQPTVPSGLSIPRNERAGFEILVPY